MQVVVDFPATDSIIRLSMFWEEGYDSLDVDFYVVIGPKDPFLYADYLDSLYNFGADVLLRSENITSFEEDSLLFATIPEGEVYVVYLSLYEFISPLTTTFNFTLEFDTGPDASEPLASFTGFFPRERMIPFLLEPMLEIQRRGNKLFITSITGRLDPF